MSVPPFRPPVPQPLHPFGWLRPKDSFEFRVTQTFAQVNAEISALPHRALDMGNGHLGARICAPAAGLIVAEGWLLAPWSQASPLSKRTLWGPNYGGIMAVIDHGNGYVSALAHLQRTIVNKGQTVKAGDQVGNLGATGAAAEMGGHVHWDLYHNGVKVDPWPLLEQNWVAPPDTSIAIPKEDVMRFGGAQLHVVSGVPSYRLSDDSNFRIGPTRAADSLGVMPEGTAVSVAYYVTGESIGGNSDWALTFLYVNKAYSSGFIHSSLLHEIEQPAPTSGPTADEVAALVRQGRQAGAKGAADAAAAYAAKQ